MLKKKDTHNRWVSFFRDARVVANATRFTFIFGGRFRIEVRQIGGNFTTQSHENIPNLPLPPNVDWIPTKVQVQVLGLKLSQYHRDKWLLTELGVAAFDRYGCDRQNFQRFWEFRQLVCERGRLAAARRMIEKYGEGKNDG